MTINLLKTLKNKNKTKQQQQQQKKKTYGEKRSVLFHLKLLLHFVYGPDCLDKY